MRPATTSIFPASSAIDTGVQVDTTAPTLGVESFNSASGTDIDAGKVVSLSIAVSEPVTVTNGGNGLPTLQLNDSEVATYSGLTGSSVEFADLLLYGAGERQRRRSEGDRLQQPYHQHHDPGCGAQQHRFFRLQRDRHRGASRHHRADAGSGIVQLRPAVPTSMPARW